jgi:hypothetical protein
MKMTTKFEQHSSEYFLKQETGLLCLPLAYIFAFGCGQKVTLTLMVDSGKFQARDVFGMEDRE